MAGAGRSSRAKGLTLESPSQICPAGIECRCPVFAQAAGLELPTAHFDRIYARTSGNAQFLVLAMNLLQCERGPACAIDRLVENDDLERYLLSEVDECLSPPEQAVMYGLAVLIH